MKFLIAFSLVLVAILAREGFRVYLLLKNSSVLVEKSSPYERRLPGAPMRVLILGDSTAVGTGATDTADSTAGRFGALYPEAEIVNLAVNGLRIKGLLSILDGLDQNVSFDIVLIQIGANDIIRLTPLQEIEKGIAQVLLKTSSIGKTVIVLHSGNIGEAKFFPWFVRPILSSRSLKVRELYKNAAQIHGAKYVDLIDSPIAKQLAEDPNTYYANDKLHLTGEGYGLWFSEIKKLLP